MNEFALILRLMAEPKPSWERMPQPVKTVVVVQAKPAAGGQVDAALAARLREIAENATGRLVFSASTGFWIVEER